MALSGSQVAYRYAQSGIARSGATRSGYHSPKPFIAIAGVHYATGRAAGPAQVDADSLTISDILNDTPDTCQFTARGFTPTVGQDVVITLGSKNTLVREFGGVILSLDVQYTDSPKVTTYAVRCIDYTWLAASRKVSGVWQNVSATVIAQALVPLGFTGVNIQPGLPPVFEPFTYINQTAPQALSALATRIGGYFYFDHQKDLHFFLVDTTLFTAPQPLLSTHPTLTAFAATYDMSQLVTRCLVQGGGVGALVSLSGSPDFGPGPQTLPVPASDWFNPGGGLVAVGAQRLSYTGLSGVGGGTAGRGASLSAMLTLGLQIGTGLGTGVYQYGYTETTALGETAVSPLASITVGGAVLAPTNAGTLAAAYGYPGGNLTAGLSGTAFCGYTYAVTFVTAFGETVPGPSSTNGWGGFPPGTLGAMLISSLPLGPAGVTKRGIYRTGVNGSVFKLVAYIADNVTRSYVDLLADSALTTSPPTTSTAGSVNAVFISNILPGPPTVTGRNLYRTVVNGSQLKLLEAIADNTTTTWGDTAADGTLGVVAPTGDSSGLAPAVIPGIGFFTAGVSFPADGVASNATTTPKFGSVAYIFVPQDVGGSLYIKSGTNWIPGWYQIVSVSLGFAFLNAPCGTVASLTAGTWGADYSAMPVPRATIIDLAIDGSNSLIVRSAAQPFGVNQVGNALTISYGLGFILQRVIIVSVAGGAATCDKSLGTLGATGGEGLISGQPTALATPAGSQTLAISSSANFLASPGGWAIVGSQIISYTGVAGNTLTGIPAFGYGSLQAPVTNGTSIVAATGLVGIPASGPGSVQYPILAGDSVNLIAQVDDAPAQVALSTLLDPSNLLGGAAGILEDYLSDSTVNYGEAYAMGLAELALRKLVNVAVTFTTRDRNTRSGQQIVVNLPAPTSVNLTLMIQQVDQSNFLPAIFPTYQAKASITRLSFEDLIRSFGGVD